MQWDNFYIYENGTLINRVTKKIAGGYTSEGYIRIRKDGKEYRAHRIIWEMFNGEIPEGFVIDHINGLKDDNRIENLRLASKVQNSANSDPKLQRSLPKGVVLLSSGKYRTRLSHQGKTYHLGCFNTIKEASDAYDNKAIELHGTFAKLNRYTQT